jgi:nifR3 family TIM-barrel protein
MSNSPQFLIRDIPVYGDVILAPMAGYADVPHRALCRSFGSALNYTEFVAVEEVIKGTNSTRSLLDFTPDDKPMVVQLFGNDARLFLEAALMVEEIGADIIDINMGCSTRRVSGRGAGVGMMPQPALIEDTFSLLCTNLSLPVTGKIRSGWETEVNYLDVARIMVDNGASLIAIHPRTKEQGYSGVADWDAIARLRAHVPVPVIGSGDICSPGDIDKMLDETGCAAVMIGRGVIGNPWLLSRIDKTTIPLEEITGTVRKHLTMMLEYHGERGLILFRKYLKRYLGDEPGFELILRQMLVTENIEDFMALLEELEDEASG